MKKLFFFAAFIILTASFSLKREPAVLVYTRNYKPDGKGYVHENIPYSVRAIITLGKELHFRVDTSSDPAVFTEENLKRYRAVIFANSNNEAFATDQQRLAFRRYIEAGGGFVGIHSSTGSERSWKWFINMQGATFLRHAVYQKYTVRVIDKNHPATKQVPEKWEKEDECYYFRQFNPAIKVLMVADLRTVQDPDKPDVFCDVSPAVWCNKFDGGRQWYTALGHNPSDYSDPVYLNHLKRGIEWVLKGSGSLDYSKAYAESPYDEFRY